ncbi:CCAAT-binding transcription factor (CBF-B/NF-YA) subunit B-domain-containing protein [Flagelloscypha sp. PMI_526]|nr:CCAAT-binding transcription factor (CBF-B/NF-YA) subunit B-domain-containing protein [Flagelloscypha sp. PMI_526]
MREAANHDALPFGVNGHVDDEVPPPPALEPAAPESEEVLYVNPKQYLRILYRRRSRARLEQLHRLAKERKPYLHESRHKHAMRRPRGPGGRFLTAQEIADQNAKQGSDHTESPETDTHPLPQPPKAAKKAAAVKGKAKATDQPPVHNLSHWSDVGPTDYPPYDPTKDSLDLFYGRSYAAEPQPTDPMLSLGGYPALPLSSLSTPGPMYGAPSPGSDVYYHPHMHPGPQHSQSHHHHHHPELTFPDPLVYPPSPEDMLARYGPMP